MNATPPGGENGNRAERVLARLDGDAVVELLRRTVQTPSITGEEADFAGLVAEELRAAGLDRVESFEFKPGRPDVWGVLEGSGNGRSVMFLGHLDTVHVKGWEDRWRGTERESPFSGAIVDGELYGRGAGDQKAGIAAVIGALKAIAAAGTRPTGDVVVAFVGDEESGEPGTGLSDGIKEIVKKIRSGEIPQADFAIYTEPTTLNVYAAQMGFLIAEITVQGESAYFGKPWLGIDALRGAHKVLGELFAYSGELWDRAEHPLLGRAFVLSYAIEGGGYIAVPERCRIELIRKILPGGTLDEAGSELESLLQKLAIQDGVRTEIRYTAARDHRLGGTPAETPPHLPAVKELGEALREVTGQTTVISGAPYWSEISFMNALGIPAVYCAPGDITNCHTLYERVEVKQVIDAAAAFARFIGKWSGLEEAS